MSKRYSRREMLRLTGQAAVATALTSRLGFAAEDRTAALRGVVVGNPVAAQVGETILAAGGNAVDAIVAAALTAAVTAPHMCGIGGYGGHMMIALARGKKVTAIDFNSAAPMAAREDMFPLDERGQVRGQVNEHGWLAAGVPGTLAGLQLALNRYGTRSFRELVAPAIQFAREGIRVNSALASSIRNATAQFRKDPASARLLLNDGEPPSAPATRFSILTSRTCWRRWPDTTPSIPSIAATLPGASRTNSRNTAAWLRSKTWRLTAPWRLSRLEWSGAVAPFARHH